MKRMRNVISAIDAILAELLKRDLAPDELKRRAMRRARANDDEYRHAETDLRLSGMIRLVVVDSAHVFRRVA